MNAIDRIGMKVVCVWDVGKLLRGCPKIRKNLPQLNEIYTVEGFGLTIGLPGIYLRELGGVTCTCINLLNDPWPIEIFRPVETGQTDIGVFEKMLSPVDVKAPEMVP